MRNGKSEKKKHWMGAVAASFAKKMTEFNMNTTCVYIAHQPQLPESAKKLRKF